MILDELIWDACQFATTLHAGQVRKYTGEPYINHPEEVVSILMATDLADDVGAIAAAWLHDVLEDCDITIEDLRKGFPSRVCDLVEELTDKKTEGNRATRKAARAVELGNASPEAQSIKCADLLSNLNSIRVYDAGFWKVYRAEALELNARMQRANHLLRRVLELELMKEDGAK